jgi:hypothetical protein
LKGEPDRASKEETLPVKGKKVRGYAHDSASFGFSDKRQTNFATVGEGAIAISDGKTDISKLNRDTTVAQYGTMDTGVQLQLDKDMLQIVDTAKKTADSVVQVYGYAKETIEKATNLVESGHFTTDDKIGYYLDMDDLKEKKERGEQLTPEERIAYYDAKVKSGEKITVDDDNDVLVATQLYIREKEDQLKEKVEYEFRYGTSEGYKAALVEYDEINHKEATALATQNRVLCERDKLVTTDNDLYERVTDGDFSGKWEKGEYILILSNGEKLTDDRLKKVVDPEIREKLACIRTANISEGIEAGELGPFDYVSPKGIIKGGIKLVIAKSIEKESVEVAASATLKTVLKNETDDAINIIASKVIPEGSEIAIRTTRGVGKGIRVTRPDGSIIDITEKRVKEYVINTDPRAPLGTLDKVKFPSSIPTLPGSKSYKRLPTSEELKVLYETTK